MKRIAIFTQPGMNVPDPEKLTLFNDATFTEPPGFSFEALVESMKDDGVRVAGLVTRGTGLHVGAVRLAESLLDNDCAETVLLASLGEAQRGFASVTMLKLGSDRMLYPREVSGRMLTEDFWPALVVWADLELRALPTELPEAA